jgi:hypothetical protein
VVKEERAAVQLLERLPVVLCLLTAEPLEALQMILLFFNPEMVEDSPAPVSCRSSEGFQDKLVFM